MFFICYLYIFSWIIQYFSCFILLIYNHLYTIRIIMLILYYVLFVLVALLFENYFISFFFLIIIIPIHYILWKKYFTFHPLHFLYIWIFFFLPIFSINNKYSLYFQNDVKCNVVCQWTIVDVTWKWKYIVKVNNYDFALKSNHSLEIWDLVLIQSNFTNYTIPSKYTYENYKLKYSAKFDYNKWLYMKWLRWSIISKKVKVIWKWELSTSVKLKQSIKKSIVQVYGEGKYAGLVLWMLIWDKSNISDQDYQGFIDSSLVHIIAVSWWNVVIIVMFLSSILFFLPYYFRLFLISLVLILYCFVCGLDSSIVRAVIMWIISYIALFLWREISIKRLITYSMFLMLAINPYYLLYDLWFQLSYMALSWLVLFSHFTKQFNLNILVKDLLNNYLFPTLWANLWVFPLLIIFIGKINLLWILWNLVVLPLVSFVMIYWFISVILYNIFQWQPIVLLLTNLLDYIYSISQLVVDYWFYIETTTIFMKILCLLLYIWTIIILYKVWKIKKNNQTIPSD